MDQSRAIVDEVRERLDLESLVPVAAPDGLAVNDLGHVRLRIADPLPAEPYADSRHRRVRPDRRCA